jgi:hypothetical protein
LKSALVILALTLSGCGYHTAGSTNLLPTSIHTIAVTPWGNGSVQYKLSDRIAQDVSRELITRTKYTIVADPARADAVLYGSVANLFSSATIVDPNPTGKGSIGGQVTVQIQVRLIGKDGKVLFNRPNLEFHERFEIGTNPAQYLDETEVALDRVSRDVARTVISAILENF